MRAARPRQHVSISDMPHASAVDAAAAGAGAGGARGPLKPAWAGMGQSALGTTTTLVPFLNMLVSQSSGLTGGLPLASGCLPTVLS